MGAYRTRRPFVWQDEMAEVRNLFRKVAQVRDSGFTGFSLWKDEPTAETLSRNRLRRRRSQYALELTHLNYGESPYDALTHLHNIRGMCSRIQRQNRYVERKKKTYDADLHPALLRRPVTASYSWASSKESSEKGSTRPVSAPVMAGTPLHYTPSKPTMLYDATHRCPRYKEATRRSSVLTSGGGGGGSHTRPAGRTVLKPMANNHNWETTTVASSSGYSSEYPLPPSSIASSTKTSLKVAPSGTDSLTPKLDEPILRRREYNSEPAAYTTAAEGESTASENETAAASVLYSEVESTDASAFSSSRGHPGVNVVERPLSRMMSKRPSPDMAKGVPGGVPGGTEQKRSGTAPHRKDVHPASGEARGGHEGSTAGSFRFASSASPRVPQGSEMLPTQTGRPPSRKAGEGGRLLDEQRGKSNPAGAAQVKGKSPLTPPSDGSAGLWALRQEQQRPTSAGPAIPRASAATSSEQASARPATSPTRGVAQNLPKLERVSRFGSSPSANKIAGKKEQLQVRAVQRAFQQELQQVVLSEYGSNEAAHNKPTRSDQQRSELKPPVGSPAQPPQLHQHQQQLQQSHHATDSGGDSFEHSSTANCARGSCEQAPHNTPTDGEENHVMIKHSTDPYADFKFSMLRMIDEEDLYDKQWELEELFQYYMDLNPAVHHEVLQIVISDIRKNIATFKARRACYADSP